jgi:hypothetical protein
MLDRSNKPHQLFLYRHARQRNPQRVISYSTVIGAWSENFSAL